MAVISVKNLSKRYPAKQVLKDVSFEIADKELTVICGLKECGKTTLLRAICGLDAVEKGEIYLDGALINKLEPKDRDMAIITSSVPLNPNASVYDNMAVGMKLRHYPKEEIDARIEKAAKLLGFNDYIRRLVKNITPGQKLRVLLARAVAREPKIVIIDDILDGVEQGLRREVVTEIVKLNKRLGINFICAVKDPVDALTLADKIVFLDDGVVIQTGTPEQLYNKPNTLQIATFFGSPKINLFQGKIVDKEGGYAFSGENLTIPLKDLPKQTAQKYSQDLSVTLAVRAEDFVLDEKGYINVYCEDCDNYESASVSSVYAEGPTDSAYFNVLFGLEPQKSHCLSIKEQGILLYDTQTEMLVF